MPLKFEGNVSNTLQNKLYLGKITKAIEKKYLTDQYYGYAEGRNFGGWITGRNDYTTSSLITLAPYIIESIFRDEIWVERDLVITKTNDTTFYCNTLSSSTADYYNGATITNITMNETDTIADFVYSTNKIMTTTNAHSGWSSNDKVVVSNIQSHIDTDSFDKAGYKAKVAGTRSGWVFARYINSKESCIDLLSSLCFESHTMLFKSYNEWKLKALDTQSSEDGTLSNPLFNGTQYMLDWELSPLEDVYTDFTINYGYDYAKGIYSGTQFVNKDRSSNASLDAYKTDCSNAVTNYKLRRKFEYNAEWIYDDTTAINLLQKLVKWYTIQRMMVDYTGDVSNHIQWELGDVALINHSRIPTGKKNTTQFMVVQQRIKPIKGRPEVNLKLMELV